jgi:hypothetical protein
MKLLASRQRAAFLNVVQECRQRCLSPGCFLRADDRVLVVADQ